LLVVVDAPRLSYLYESHVTVPWRGFTFREPTVGTVGRELDVQREMLKVTTIQTISTSSLALDFHFHLVARYGHAGIANDSSSSSLDAVFEFGT
jgi:hypothetical protein